MKNGKHMKGRVITMSEKPTKPTILMTLMGLEIGGAETHVVELAKELNKQGYNIIVASNGGVYEKELTDVGIKHYNVPMNKRNVLKMIKSYFLLKDIIIKENIDIVHSHARIPGFICGFLHKKMKFTFVTSAHWVFYTGMGLKYLTNWGQKVVAVSDDIKQYLIDNYGIRQKDIYVTINGIDTDKFSPDTPKDRIAKELGLKGEITLVYVSRMDESRAMVAKQLINITPELCGEFPDLRIIIVGGGDVFDELKNKAEKINSKLGRTCITMTGARTDINELIAVGDAFIGVSRSALEAMAEEKPVIVAGNEGYIGLFSQEKLELSRENNFCCRGCIMPTEDLLKKDTIKMLKLTKEEKQDLGRYGRQVIFDYYSVSKMARDCIVAYDAALELKNKKIHNVLMSGYYGFNNSGDEAILLSMHKNIEKLGDNIHITVLSNRPDETKNKYGVNVVYRFSFLEVFRAIRHCDVLLSGGGSLLQDTTSTRSLMYYLSIILLAKLCRKKVMLYANGIGPVSKNSNRHIVKMVVNKADTITLREENSYEELRSMGVTNPNAFVTADPVFTMEGISKEAGLEVLKNIGVPTDRPIVGVSVRNWKGIDQFVDEFAALCDDIYEKYNRSIVFIVMQVPNDINVSEKVQQKMKNPSFVLKENYSPYEIMGMISAMDFILSMRLHTLIFAARQRIPLIGFVYDPKIEYYLEKINMPIGGKVGDFNKESAMEKVDDMINNRQKYLDILETAAKELEEAAHKNEDYLIELLDK